MLDMQAHQTELVATGQEALRELQAILSSEGTLTPDTWEQLRVLTESILLVSRLLELMQFKESILMESPAEVVRKLTL